MANHRGRNWGLPRTVHGSVPLSRPIRLDCYADRLEIAPEPGVAPGRVIPLGADTEGAIEELISAIWQRIDSWGVAGRGMYWRPVLNVRVAPGGQRRFAELEILLDQSGVEVARKDEPIAPRSALRPERESQPTRNP
ncbi:MAG TPA: hypothetical protein EYP56_05765 [Planctomycetaceae bacterium]|nr:hypothetical protein [Planctomycetaceae bacterium]